MSVASVVYSALFASGLPYITFFTDTKSQMTMYDIQKYSNVFLAGYFFVDMYIMM